MCKKISVIAGVHGVGKTSLLGILRGEYDNGFGEVIETTLEEPGVLETIKVAAKRGCYVKLYYIILNTAEESIKRLEHRAAKGGKSMESEVVINCFKNRFERLAEIFPYCDEMLFFNNENGFEMIGKYKKGRKNNGKEMESRKEFCCQRS